MLEKADLHVLYGLVNGNALEFRRKYVECFPNNYLRFTQMLKPNLCLQEKGTSAKSRNIIYYIVYSMHSSLAT